MATYKIKNYIKLLAIRIDHFESILINELNSDDPDEIEKFIERFRGIAGVKIVMIEMNTHEMITFDELKKYIHNAHVFDYLRHLVADGHKMLTADDSGGVSIGAFVKCLLDVE